MLFQNLFKQSVTQLALNHSMSILRQYNEQFCLCCLSTAKFAAVVASQSDGRENIAKTNRKALWTLLIFYFCLL